MMKYISVFLFLCFVPIGCYAEGCEDLDKNSCSVLKNFIVADKDNELHFEHLCSELDHHNYHYQGSYAFFEKTDVSRNYKALALGEVSVGHIGWAGVDDKKGIWFNMEKMKLESLNEWANDSISLALRMKNTRTNQIVTGKSSNTFFYSYRGGGLPTDKKYSVSKEGQLEWEQFREPEEETAEAQTEAQANCISCEEPGGKARRNEHKISDGMYIESSQITHKKDPHTLYLVLKNERTGEEIQLQGPVLNNLKTYMDTEYSGPRVLTWEVLMPGQQGGLWDWISDARKYNDCIYLRKQGKKEFTTRFTNQ